MAEPQPRRRWGRLVPALWLVAILAGCSGYLTEEGDPSAPILVRGRVVDASGGGMSGAGIHLTAFENPGGAAPGVAVPAVYDGEFRAGLDGTFTIRLAPTPALTELAKNNGGFVNFTLVAFRGGAASPFAFPRELVDGTWAGAVPSFVFGPNGVSETGVDPGLPAPIPAAT